MTQQLDVDGGRPPRPAAKKRHPWRKLLIAVLVVIALLVAADFGLATAAEYQVSTKLKSQLHLRKDPEVAIRGFPFITQALSSDYDHVTVDANGVHLGGSFRDLQIHADLRHVRVHISDLLGGSLKEIPIDEVKGKVAIKADDIDRLLAANPVGERLGLTDLTIDPATVKKVLSTNDDDDSSDDDSADDKKSDADDTYQKQTGVRLGAHMKLAGEKTWITAYALINLDDGKISIAPKKLTLKNDKISSALPSAIEHRILQSFAITLDPGELPFHAAARGVDVDPGSVSVKGEADNVVIPLGG